MMPLRAGQLRGSFVPLVTPFASGEVDADTLGALIEWHVEQGSHGIVIGSQHTGEAQWLTAAERRRLVELAVEMAACRIEVLVAATGNDPDDVGLAEHASGAGADGVIIAPPSRGHDRAVVADVAELAGRTDLPVLIHRRRATRFSAFVDLAQLTEITLLAPNVRGVQQSVFDMRFLTEVRATFGDDFRILADVDELTYFMLAGGAHGCVAPVANVVPARMAELYYAVEKDGFAEGRAAHARLYELSSTVTSDADPLSIKHMMHRLGLIPNTEHRAPAAMTDEAAAQLDAVLAVAGLSSAMETSRPT